MGRIFKEVGQGKRIGWHMFLALTPSRLTNKDSQRSSVASFLVLFLFVIFVTWLV